MIKIAGWALFLASMFIGMGIGMLFNATGAGTIIGMGVGFLLMGIENLGKEEEMGSVEASDKHVITRKEGRIVGVFASSIIGICFIIGGLSMIGVITIPEYLYKYLGATVMIIIGLTILLAGIHSLRRSGR